MRKVLRLFEEEKQEAVREAVREAIARIEREKTIEIAESLLDILSPEMIAEKTGLAVEEVEKLKER